MTVQELLKQSDFDAQARLVCERETTFSGKKYDFDKVKASYREFVQMLLSLEAKPSKDFILFERYWWDDDDGIKETVESELYEYDNFVSVGKDLMDLEYDCSNVSFDMPLVELEKHVSEFPSLPQTFAYEFTEWETILGYQVYEENFKKFDVQDCIYAVLYEMSFNGMDRESQLERKEELDASVAEVDEIMALPEEERDCRLHSFDDVMKEWGYEDTRTQAQKDEELRSMYYCSLKRLCEKYKDVKEYYHLIVTG